MKTVLDEYRKSRAAGATAINALRTARYNVRMASADYPRYTDSPVYMELPRGERIRMELEPDCDADPDERLNVSREDVPRYSDVTEHAHDGWIDRDGRVLFDAAGNRSSRYHWQWWSDDYGFTQFWKDSKRQNSRHAAWLRAREMVAQSFEYYREAREDGYVGYILTLLDADGDEVESESCWGFEASGDYAGQEAYAEAESMAEQRAKYWQARETEARETMRETRQQYAQAASEYRALRSHADATLFPAACAAIRDNLDRLAMRFNDALRVVTA